MLNRDEAVLILIDVQGRLHEVMNDKEALDINLVRMIECAKILGIPILCTEQIPEKLGTTNEPFLSLLDGVPTIAKSAFSCCGEEKFMEAFREIGRRQVILIGIEAHVCVYQTAIDLLAQGNEVFVVADAVASRKLESKALALQAMRDDGAKVIPAETTIFSLLRDAGDPRFKALLKLVK